MRFTQIVQRKNGGSRQKKKCSDPKGQQLHIKVIEVLRPLYTAKHLTAEGACRPPTHQCQSKKGRRRWKRHMQPSRPSTIAMPSVSSCRFFMHWCHERMPKNTTNPKQEPWSCTFFAFWTCTSLVSIKTGWTTQQQRLLLCKSWQNCWRGPFSLSASASAVLTVLKFDPKDCLTKCSWQCK